MKAVHTINWLACAAISALVALAPAAPAQAQQYTGWQSQAPFTQQELDQMLAPIALYPDALLAQVLMAATYPLEVVQAARFMQRNPRLSGDTLARAVEPMRWDPSVAALTQFPSVLAMMNEELDWTQQLGEAFLAQRVQVMDTVQMLRARAHAAGTLRSNEQQRVIVEERVIVIEPWQYGTYWVPYYNPMIVFGTWWWPAYRPFIWVPPVIYRPPYFAQIYSIGIVWGPFTVVFSSLWNDPRPIWRDRPIYIDSRPVVNVIVTGATTPRPVPWQHDPVHRRNVEYRTPAVRDRYPPVFPEKPTRPAQSVQPSREPYYQAPRQPGVQPPRDRLPVPDTRSVPRQQVPVKPSAGSPQRSAPQRSVPQPSAPQRTAPQQAPRGSVPAPRPAPAVREPATRQPNARQPDARQSNVRQPDARQPAARQQSQPQRPPRSQSQREDRSGGGQAADRSQRQSPQSPWTTPR